MSQLFGFMNSVRNRRAKEKAANAETEKKNELTAKTRRASAIPKIVLVIANIIILTLDFRVFDVVYKITDSVILAVFAIVPTGIMFIVWYDMLYSNYPLAGRGQKYLSLAGAGLCLVLAAVFA